MQFEEIALRRFQFHSCIPEFLEYFSQTYQIFTFHLAVNYNIVYIGIEKITKIFEEKFEHSIQEYAWCMSNAITDLLSLEFSVGANKSVLGLDSG